jgi:transcriptional regulator NrdR family protein
MINYIVIKKDSSEEEFNPDKIITVIKEAGATESVAKLVVKNVIKRLFKIKSNKLRRLVYKYLKKIDRKAANNYRKHYIKSPN